MSFTVHYSCIFARTLSIAISLHSLSTSLLNLIRWVKNYTEIFRHAVLIHIRTLPTTNPSTFLFPEMLPSWLKMAGISVLFCFLTNELNSQKV